MVVVGLTGDVGAGKSTLAHLWSGMGATVVSADAIVARLWNSPDILDAVRKRLGPDVFDPLDLVSPMTTRACNRMPWLQDIFMDGQRA